MNNKIIPRAGLGWEVLSDCFLGGFFPSLLSLPPLPRPFLALSECSIFWLIPGLRTFCSISGSRANMWPSGMLVTKQKPGSGSRLWCRKSGWWGPHPWEETKLCCPQPLLCQLPIPTSGGSGPHPKGQWWESASLTWPKTTTARAQTEV